MPQATVGHWTMTHNDDPRYSAASDNYSTVTNDGRRCEVVIMLRAGDMKPGGDSHISLWSPDPTFPLDISGTTRLRDGRVYQHDPLVFIRFCKDAALNWDLPENVKSQIRDYLTQSTGRTQ